MIATQHSVLTALGSRVFCFVLLLLLLLFLLLLFSVSNHFPKCTSLFYLHTLRSREESINDAQELTVSVCLSVCGIRRSRVAMDLRLEKSLKGSGLGMGDTEDRLLPMQQVPPAPLTPLHVTDVILGKARAHAVWHQYHCRSCQNGVKSTTNCPRDSSSGFLLGVYSRSLSRDRVWLQGSRGLESGFPSPR